MLISLVNVPCIRACNFLVMYNFLGLGGGIGFKSSNLCSGTDSYNTQILIYNPLLTISWEMYYSDPYTVNPTPKHKSKTTFTPPQNPECLKGLILEFRLPFSSSLLHFFLAILLLPIKHF